MQSLKNYIIEATTSEYKKFITENKISKMSDTEWLNYEYGGNGRYIQNIYDRVQTHALYGISANEVETWKERLSRNKGISRFRKVSANSKYYAILCFRYDRSKDEAYQKAVNGEAERERIEAEKFAEEVKHADTSKYSTSDKDVEKMKYYRDKGSNTVRLVNSIKDDKKLVARWLAAMIIDWKDAVNTFGREIGILRNILTKAEITAYTEKYKNQKLN